MSTETVSLPAKQPDRSLLSGWTGIGLMALLYAAAYAANLLLPPGQSSYTTRIWSWSELALSAGALLVILARWRKVQARQVLLSGALALLSGLSMYSRFQGWADTLQGTAAVFLTMQAGILLFAESDGRKIRYFDGGTKSVIRSVLAGIAIGIPLAAVNNGYFFLTNGRVEFQNVFGSALEALDPGISEEAVYRFFIIAACLKLLEHAGGSLWVVPAAVFMSVVPHSLNHLPDLLRANPGAALFLFAATSLLFGLPMALVQVRKNLEAAMALHWWVDFARFWMGF